MSVLFCLWADKEEEEGGDDLVDENKEIKENEIIVNPAISNEESSNGCESDGLAKNAEQVNSGAEDTSESCKDDNMSSCSIREPVDEVAATEDVDSVKDCLRPPGMVFSVWKDSDEHWESDASEDCSEEGDHRPKFFSFTVPQDKEEFEYEQDGNKIKDDHYDEEGKDDEHVDDNLDDVSVHEEQETEKVEELVRNVSWESDDSVDNLVIQKVETSSPLVAIQLKTVKSEPKAETFDDHEHDDDYHVENISINKSFARKSTTQRRRFLTNKPVSVDISKISVNKFMSTKSNKRHASKVEEKVEKVLSGAHVSGSKRKRFNVPTPSKAVSTVHNTRTSRPRRMLDTNIDRNTTEKMFARPEPGEVKIEAADCEDQVETYNFSTDTIEVEESIAQLKMEEKEGIELLIEDAYEYTSLGDPLGDPLSTQLCSSVKDRPFLWPKLDPLFHTVTEFKLSKEFAKLIKALQKPTAKIQPLVRSTLSQPRVKTDVKEEARLVSPPTPATTSRPQRTGKRKTPYGVPTSELRSLLSPSLFYTHPPAKILPSRRRSLRQEADKELGDKKVKDQEEGAKTGSRKRKPFPPVTNTPDTGQLAKPGQLNKQNVRRARSVVDRRRKGTARPDVSIVGSVSGQVGGGGPSGQYMVVCKTGSYQCPLCGTRWSLNQTYGRHVVTRTCQVEQDKVSLTSAPWILAEADHDEDVAILDENVSPRNNIFVFVTPATTKKDSYVSTSHVPALKLLCRGVMPKCSSPPPLKVKEGLEYYHALVWPDNNKEEVVFRYMCSQAKITLVSSVMEYEKLCREPLKVALYLEKKISKSREKMGPRHSQTKRWVEKYILYLTFPLHDIFLVVSQAGYRVLEFPLKESKVGLLCLVCPTMSCVGCLTKQTTKLPTWQPGKKPPLKVPVRTMHKVRKVMDKDKPHMSHIKPVATNTSTVPLTPLVHKTSKSDSDDIVTQTVTSVTTPIVPPLQLHICSPCKTVFNSRLALSSHKGLCRGAVGE